ncbi:hypothetical protein C3489_15320 [Streptomyces sp. Ru71]|nr:hypothetical protein C3489_15320 [Streptomyces sp. Ru71]
MREQGFELREHRLDRHRGNLRELTGVTIQRNPVGALPRTPHRSACASICFHRRGSSRSAAAARASSLPYSSP